MDPDWALTEPQYADIILTSILKNYDTTVVQAVASIEANIFAGGLHIGTLEDDSVSLAPIHQLDSLISSKVKADLELIVADIISGKITTKP